MRTFPRVIAISAIVMGALSSTASAQTLGSSFASVQRTYAAAEPVLLSGRKALELADIKYAGVRWRRVDFVFDAAGRLSQLSMTTDSSTYEAVLQLAQLQLTAPQTSGRVSATQEDTTNDMQIRVCQGGRGQITLTYEPISTLS